MFQTDIHLWLQSFASPLMTWLMRAVTFMGYDWVYLVLVVAAVFGSRLRPGLSLTLALMLSSLAVHGGKAFFELPRPSDVDAGVLDKGRTRVPLVDHGGGATFWSLPSPAARRAIRSMDDPDFGFPSGHVAAATAGWVGLMVFVGQRRRRAWWMLAAAWPLAMAVSRMYLGRHFLADVLAGLAIGAWAVATAFLLTRTQRPFSVVSLLAALPILAMMLAWPVRASDVGGLAGLAVVLAWFAVRGVPHETPGAWAAGGRMLIGASFVVGTRALAHGVPEGHVLLAGLSAAGCTVLAFLGAVYVGQQCAFYRRA
ncbi:phosphatase PAP2 family protein [Luteibacter sp. CQ10]|uniref:phosphatase PAP2 family protein n=1 Tax=Luteibacter sp. CQ10 TaxID=2805821 RepID=UPI0034A2FBD2